MGKRIFSLMFSPIGRIDRRGYILGVILLIVFVITQGFIYPLFRAGSGQFFGGMIFFFLNLHIMMCVYAKRLHDLGHGLWPLVGMISLTLFVMTIVMLNFGGLDYFNTIYDNPELAHDTELMKKVHEVYEARLASARPMADIIMGVIPFVFTIWLAVVQGQKTANKFGPLIAP